MVMCGFGSHDVALMALRYRCVHSTTVNQWLDRGPKETVAPPELEVPSGPVATSHPSTYSTDGGP